MGNEPSGQASADVLNSREVSAMDSELRRKLGHGTCWNMKVVVRGDRNVGKTQLWQRLQGKQFAAAYIPTERIQVATINWSYKTTSDIVKVEVWDVVDRGKKKKRKAGLKIANEDAAAGATEDKDEGEDEGEEGGTAETVEPSKRVEILERVGSPNPTSGSFTIATLDATTVDVMRGTTSAIFVFDITKRWTWDYVTRELPAAIAAAAGMHVLVVGNFRDMGSHRVITELEASEWCRSQGENVHYVEASMRDAFGVKAIAAFFNLPFLFLRRQAILAELRKNDEDTRAVRDELDTLRKELTYETYLRQLQDKKAAVKTPAALSSPPSVPAAQEPKPAAALESKPAPAPAAAAVPQETTPSQPVEVPQKPESVVNRSAGGAQSLKSLWRKVTEVATTATKKAEDAVAPAPESSQHGSPPPHKDDDEAAALAAKQKQVAEEQHRAAKEKAEKEKKAEREKAEREAKEKAEKEKAEKLRLEEIERRKKEKEKKSAVPPKVAEAKKKQEELSAVDELKKMAKQPGGKATIESADDFRPDELDESFWTAPSGVTEDGWVVSSKGQKETLGAEDDEEPAPTAKGGKKKKRAVFLADDEEPI